MNDHKNWKEFIKTILVGSKQFEILSRSFKDQTEIEIFKSTNKNSLTEIHVGYLKENLLIYLQFFNPIVPGYNKYVEGEYFYKYDFEKDKSYGDPALEFNKRNKEGVLSILQKGLKGKEIQFIKNNKILKSNLYISESQTNFSYSYYFIRRNLFNKLFGKRVENIEGIEKRVIQLENIFTGI